MKLTKMAIAVLGAINAMVFGSATPVRRLSFRDSASAFPYRMGAGFQGDVNRTHPVDIEANKMDASAPPTFYGQPVLMAATGNGVRAVDASDDAITNIYGVTARPYPISQGSGGPSASFGAATIPTTPGAAPIVDVMRNGLIMVKVPASQGTGAVKGGPVYIWTAASSGEHIVGGFEVTNTPGSVAALDPNFYTFNGPGDADGNIEISVRK